MSAPPRQAMRLLSPRLQCLKPKPSPAFSQMRHASSRYSNPSKRTATTAAAPAPSFIGLSPAPEAPRNPLDARANYVEWQARRQYHMRRIRFAGMGLLLSFGVMTMIIFNLDLDGIEQAEKKRRGQQLDASDEANAKFQGKAVHVIGAGEGKKIVAQSNGEEVELVETGTSHVPHFPRTIHLPTGSSESTTDQEEYTLVGLGIRTVMWLQVYVVGMYVRTKDISALQEKLIHSVNPTASTLIPSEKNELKDKLLDPTQSREMWDELLKVPGLKTAFRISPTRNTDFGHLRDGFVNAINKRKAEARKAVAGGETEYDSEEFGNAVQNLKSIFSGGKAPKGSVLIFRRDTSGALDILFTATPEKKKAETKHMGTVFDERIAKLIWLGYLSGDKVSSTAARDSVVDGCIGFASRPVGSIETMVT